MATIGSIVRACLYRGKRRKVNKTLAYDLRLKSLLLKAKNGIDGEIHCEKWSTKIVFDGKIVM